MTPVIEVKNLSKSYGDLTAVDSLSFHVNQGQVFAFLGQNGAGKSTTIRMLLTLVKPDSGSVKMFGEDVFRHRISILRKVGAIIERPDLYTNLTGIENLRLFARLNGISVSADTLNELLGQVGLNGRGTDKVRNYSLGMKQRLGLAVALVHDPELIILDEPTNGLDPQGIVDVRNLIRFLAHEKNKTVFISSHLLSEVEQVADHILIIERGKHVAQGSVRELLQPENTLVEMNTSQNESCLKWIRNSGWDKNAHLNGNLIIIHLDTAKLPGFSRAVFENGFDIISFTPTQTLEKYFLSLVQ